MNQGQRTTKERILDAAERLFGEHGFAATSLRSVIAEANVNLAAVHYHFGSKEALIAAVIHRRVDPLNQARLLLLEQYEREAAAGRPRLEKLVHAFVAPLMRHSEDPEHGWIFMKLLGRLLAEPEILYRILPAEFQETGRRFLEAFEKVLPGIPPAEVFWRMMFSVGAMAQTMRVGPRMPVFSNGLCRAGDVEESVRRLQVFLVGGFQAPASGVDS